MVTREEAWPDFPALGGLLYALVNEENRTGERFGSPEFYAKIVERLMVSGHLVTLKYAHAEADVASARSERAEQNYRQQLREAREVYATRAGTVREDLAAMLRARADNPRYVAGKFKREGVLLAADWLAPVVAGDAS